MRAVAAGIIRRGDRILICQRPEGKSLAGKWEFPGGKLEAGETPEECLVRELREELGFEARVEGIVDARAEYEAGDFLILYYNVVVVSGEPSPLEHAQIKFVPPCELAEYDFPGTDAAVAEKLAAAD